MTKSNTRRGFTQIKRVGQALPDNAPAKRHLAAFTLIELLVVVLIIGILAAVAVPQYKVAVAKARTTQAITTLKSMTDAQEVYFLANGEYTNNLSELDVAVNNDENYSYSCIERRYCMAVPKTTTLPWISFHLLHQTADHKHQSGKHWCELHGGSDTEQVQKICKTLGTEDSTMPAGLYFLIN